MKKAFIYGTDLEQGGYPEACPFNTSRARRVRETLQGMAILSGDDRLEVVPEAATREELEGFHTPEYLDALGRAGLGTLSPDEALVAGLGTPDCPIFPNMYDYLALAAGASITGARLILAGDTDAAFNPSGGLHHAQPGHAAGFCFLNDIVLAAQAFTQAGRRVLFLDIDVHHCDGVQDAFYRRADIMTVSLHESGRTLFPGTGFENEIGEGEGRGFTVNIPLPVGTYDAAYEYAFREAAWPVMEAYDPDVIILEVGMDTLAGDPLAHLNLTNNVPADIFARVMSLGKPVLATGGGGYHVENTVRGWALCWSVLCGEDVSHDLSFGMGGVMLENTDWLGGLRDRTLLCDGGNREQIDQAIRDTVAKIRAQVFPCHGL